MKFSKAVLLKNSHQCDKDTKLAAAGGSPAGMISTMFLGNNF